MTTENEISFCDMTYTTTIWHSQFERHISSGSDFTIGRAGLVHKLWIRDTDHAGSDPSVDY